ncbi:MAG: HAD-IA family hydrolase [Elusimicrobia bacterium]|nr:HAD-IA family hydrolase [Elusimicrobiota bacterium]
MSGSGLKAVVFDMDGVIIDSELQWRLATPELLGEIARRWDPEHDGHVVGFGVVDLYEWLVETYGLKETKESFLSRSDAMARDIYGSRVTLSDGFLEFATHLKTRGLGLAIASSSPRHWIEMVLRRFSLSSLLGTVVSADDVGGKTKPEPDTYLMAARKLGIAPDLCLAIEDSSRGVAAAKRAGMLCAGFRSGNNPEQNLSEADIEIRGFKDLDYESLTSRLSLA